ncbi:ATP-binding protein [Streptomyces sp. ZAF1911]|uniref:ATP-binding protein n=1 Tax=unclassified Streptomyces TaxID=2593676 RepID=UPI00237C34B1|nr:ATP-binding protein [Streptomyces sp. ZAF1911]MDD9377638.1 ATP-binding protein [Streptomyces sp. ZAF1911]
MERQDVRNYPPRQDSVPRARRHSAWLAVAWGQPELASDVALLTSELLTNALLHGSLWDRYLRVAVQLTGAVLRIEVTDPKGERRPEPRAVSEDDQFGRGLHIVSALSERWGSCDRVVGKTVWAELAHGGGHRSPR